MNRTSHRASSGLDGRSSPTAAQPSSHAALPVVLAATLLAAAAHAQSTLSLDGQTAVVRALGATVDVAVTGQAGSLAALMFDTDATPTSVLGLTIPLGISPNFSIVTIGFFPSPTGQIDLDLTIPHQEALHATQLYLAAISFDTTAPGGLVVSNRADLKLTARPQLAGNPLTNYPHFLHATAINKQTPVHLGIDPRYTFVAGKTADVYVVAHKTPAQWQAAPALVDVRGNSQLVTFPAGASTIQQNTFQLDAGTLPWPSEASNGQDTRIGVPYDVVIDFDQDGLFDDGEDLIDGYSDVEAGFYVCRDLARGSTSTLPNQGPYTVTSVTYSGGSFLGQKTYFPTAIGTLGQLPLVVVSHGNGHDYQWYNHIGFHLASYGFVVMSHQNNTMPGSHTAATTTLQNTDYLLGNLATIAAGQLQGHIDTHKIVWLGHSRGGDGVARAYDQLFRGVVTPTNYTMADIKLVSAMAPVDFGGWDGTQVLLGGAGNGSHPHDANFHLWVAQADSDVNGCASVPQTFWYGIHERATRQRQSISLYGVGHGDLHDGTGGAFASGPQLIGRPATHTLMRGYLLALVSYHILGDVPSRDYLWRQFESFRAVGASTATGVAVNMMLRDDPNGGNVYVIDDFQNQSFASPNLATSGAQVTIGVQAFVEGRADDANGDFSANVNDPFNGFTMDEFTGNGPLRSDSFSCVFGFDGSSSPELVYDLSTAGNRPNFRQFDYLSFRAAQGSRHPLTTAALGDLTFSVALEDEVGNRSTINIGTYGGGVEEPYQRNSDPACGTGNGWNSEFETIRIRLTDFLNNGTTLDLSRVRKVVFAFGPGNGSPQGRLALDEIELLRR